MDGANQYAKEVVCGGLSGLAVAPVVSIVDKAIFSNASGRAPLLQCIKDSFSSMFR